MIVKVTEIRKIGPVVTVVYEGRHLKIEQEMKVGSGREIRIDDMFDLNFTPHIAEPEEEVADGG